MSPGDKEALEAAVRQVAEHVQNFKTAQRDVLKNSLPIRINVNAGGFGAALTVLILFSIILGFTYVRTQTRLDGLYDRLDAIYMMAPQLQQDSTHEHHHPDPATQAPGIDSSRPGP